MKLLREPLVHFLLLGAVLFGGFALLGDRGSARTGQIVVTPGHLEHLTVSFTRTWQRPPTAPELAGLIDDYIREEVLYREAVGLGGVRHAQAHELRPGYLEVRQTGPETFAVLWQGAFLGLVGLPLPGVEVGIALSALLPWFDKTWKPGDIEEVRAN